MLFEWRIYWTLLKSPKNCLLLKIIRHTHKVISHQHCCTCQIVCTKPMRRWIEKRGYWGERETHADIELHPAGWKENRCDWRHLCRWGIHLSRHGIRFFQNRFNSTPQETSITTRTHASTHHYLCLSLSFQTKNLTSFTTICYVTCLWKCSIFKWVCCMSSASVVQLWCSDLSSMSIFLFQPRT